MNWRFLETFLVMTENLSFSTTANILNTAQPVVSRHIKSLEESLGYPLFIRSKRVVVLTKEGIELKRQILPLLKEMKKILSPLNEDPEAQRLDIRVGSMHEAGEILLISKISEYLEENKRVNIHVNLMSSIDIVEKIQSGEFDFGFVYILPEQKTIMAFDVFGDTPVLVGPNGSSKNWKELKSIPLLSYRENDHYTKSFIKQNFSKKEKEKFAFRSSVNSHRCIVNLICHGQGFSVLPLSSFNAFKKKNNIEILKAHKTKQSLYLICHEQIMMDRRKKDFCNFLIRKFKNQ